MTSPAKNTVCLWYDGNAEEAARFYAQTFPDSSVGAVHRAPGDFPSGKRGDAATWSMLIVLIELPPWNNLEVRTETSLLSHLR